MNDGEEVLLPLRAVALPAFTDNYIWLVINERTRQAIVVDPGQASVVEAALKERNLELQAIVLTHHHADHTGGVVQLQRLSGCHVYAPEGEILELPRLSNGAEMIPVSGDDREFSLDLLGIRWQVIDVPGHTRGHIAWFTNQYDKTAPMLFCGDTLFSGGCGRLFEGTPEQMHASLEKLSALPANTQVFSAHEYTVSNLAFAQAVEPENDAIANYAQWCKAQRLAHRPTLPSTIERERKVNPFLRCHKEAVVQAARRFCQTPNPILEPAQVLAALRAWKNVFV